MKINVLSGATIAISGLFLLTACGSSPAEPPELPHWDRQALDRPASIRGLSAVNEQVAWLSGSDNTIARTTDGGATWQLLPPPSADTLDFRDIEAFDSLRAVVMSAGPGRRSRIFLTSDGGQSWSLALENTDSNGFFNGLAFWDDQHGLLTGDPLEGALFIARTDDGGRSWQRVPPGQLPPVDSLEYGFAASGSHIATGSDNQAWIGTGGASSRVFFSADGGRSWEVAATPMIQGQPSTGIFSLLVASDGRGVAVGGDYARDTLTGQNLLTTTDGGRSWQLVPGRQLPYRSCVRRAGEVLLAAGPTGTDLSRDWGRSWQPVDSTGFHVISVGDSENAVWAAGAEGRVARLRWE